MPRIIRVFPTKTRASPDDSLAYFGPPDFWAQDDEVHISVAFSWDLAKAQALEKEWRHVAPVKIGGPATGMRGENFLPGMYVKRGYTITSRGCPNRCWFCSVWRRDGDIRELPIRPGHNVLDDNLLACSPEHIAAVFKMLSTQQQVEFSGGLEAKRVTFELAQKLYDIHPKQMFFAYDTPDDLEPLVIAGQLLQSAGFKPCWSMRAYVLCGFPKDTLSAAEQRMHQTIAAGFMPMAMVYRDRNGNKQPAWARWQRQWARPAAMRHICDLLTCCEPLPLA